jgi:hypothetical protein
LIDKAFDAGFDPTSKLQQHGQVSGTQSKIGAAETWALFRSLRIPVVLIDIYSDGPNTLHRWLVHYFRTRLNLGAEPAKTTEESNDPADVDDNND